MDNKIKEFCSTYYEGYVISKINGTYFDIKNKKTSEKYSNIQMIEFINENKLPKEATNVFLIKTSSSINPYYIIYFKVDNNKMCITVDEKDYFDIKIDYYDIKTNYKGYWENIDESPLNPFNVDREFKNKVEKVVNDLKRELKTNTKERIHFLLNKESSVWKEKL